MIAQVRFGKSPMVVSSRILRIELNCPTVVCFGGLIVQLRFDILLVVTKFFYDEKNDKDGAKGYRYEFQDALLEHRGISDPSPGMVFSGPPFIA